MNRIWYAVLLLLCIVTVILQGMGLPEYIQSVRVTEFGTSPPVSPVMSVAAITSLVAWIWGLVLAIRQKRWSWLISFFFLSYLAVGLFAALRLFRGTTQSQLQEV
jgi:hypothetical protein